MSREPSMVLQYFSARIRRQMRDIEASPRRRNFLYLLTTGSPVNFWKNIVIQLSFSDLSPSVVELTTKSRMNCLADKLEQLYHHYSETSIRNQIAVVGSLFYFIPLKPNKHCVVCCWAVDIKLWQKRRLLPSPTIFSQIFVKKKVCQLVLEAKTTLTRAHTYSVINGDGGICLAPRNRSMMESFSGATEVL